MAAPAYAYSWIYFMNTSLNLLQKLLFLFCSTKLFLQIVVFLIEIYPQIRIFSVNSN